MARYTFRLPDIGEGIAEAEIVAWHVAIGDRVEEDGRLADMMTGKATVEMESPVAGRVVELAGEVGDMVPIGAALVVLETEQGEAAPAPMSRDVEQRIEAETPDAEDVARVKEANQSPAAQADFARTGPDASQSRHLEENRGSSTSQGRADLSRERQLPTSARAEPGEARSPPPDQPKVLASPAVRHRARELGIHLGDVRPAADDGRIRHGDLDAFLAYGAARGYAAAGPAGADEQVRVVGLRRRIAEAMAASKRHIPHFSYVEECDVTDLEAVRAQLNAELGAQGEWRPRLTLLPFLIVAICRSVPAWPMLNARYDDEASVVTRHGAVHLGLATQTPAGLMVPVIRNAQALNLWQLAGEIARLAQAARDGSALPGELSGSTLTVTSLGALGGIASTPIVNRPEVAIIGPNRIVERPMFVADGLAGERLARRKLMNLSLSCDHRVIDGWEAASFVQAVKRLLEAPALLLAPPIDSPDTLP